MAIMTDHACRKWCTDPSSEQWRSAFRQWFRFVNPNLFPKVASSSAHPRQPVTFQRVMK